MEQKGKHRILAALLLVQIVWFSACGVGPGTVPGSGSPAENPEGPDGAPEQAKLESAGDTFSAEEMEAIQQAGGALVRAELDAEIDAKYMLRYDDFIAIFPLTEGTTRERLPVTVSYLAVFGGKRGSGFTQPVRCTLYLRQEPDGSFSEVPDARTYEILGNSVFDNFTTITDHPYVAWVAKEDVQGKGQDEIVSLLFCQWMDTLKNWDTSARTFLVTDYEDPNVWLVSSTDAADWGTILETEGSRPKYPHALRSWVYSCACRYQYVGYTGNVSLGSPWSGKALGVEPVWVENFSSGFNGSHFVLTEWQDCYTLETRTHCLASMGKIS